MSQIASPAPNPKKFFYVTIFPALVLTYLSASCSLTSNPFSLMQIDSPDGVCLVKLSHIGQKERWDCGIGALAMVYNYWGDTIPYDEILSDIFRTKGKRDAVLAKDLKEHAEQRGYHAFILRTELEDILEQIHKGRPVIVCRKILWGVNHYEVVFGYDANRKEVFIDDPAKGQVRRRESAFRRQHRRMNGFSMLVVPK